MRNSSAPMAMKKPHTTIIHGHERIDNYAWLRDRNNPEVIAHLEEENRYAESVMKHARVLQNTLFEEMKGRIPAVDMSAPVRRRGDYWYYSRTEAGKQYSLHCRRKYSMNAPEEVLLDENRLAKGRDFFKIGVFVISPDQRKLAYSVDIKGSLHFTLFVRDLDTGETLKEHIPNTDTSLAWHNSSNAFFYTVLDQAVRPFRVFKHVLGTMHDLDALVYQEDDERFSVSVCNTRSRKYVFVEIRSRVTTELRFMSADTDRVSLDVFLPREEGHEYSVDHSGAAFFVLTNDNAPNFRLVTTPETQTSKEHWQEIVPHSDDVTLEGMDAFQDHLVLYERSGGLPQLRIFDLKTMADHRVAFPEQTYSVAGSRNPIFESATVRYMYTSLVTPLATFEYNMRTRERTQIKQEEVVGGYDPSLYTVERAFATAHDGARIPISLVYKRALKREGGNPLFLTGYGSYGVSYDAEFSSQRISLLDRGFVFAIAHIRGGGDMGRQWYEHGKYLNKKNTFYDFIACGEYLVEAGYTTKERVIISGVSAGGLLVGAVVNMRPDLWGAAIAGVPFVDVINTMLDQTLPLTAGEYEEWGNPNEKTYYEYMFSYSPYDQVSSQSYPRMLVTAGLNDSQVPYWEPAKWVAKLRELKQDGNILLLKTNMGAGHHGASGRYDRLKERAFEYAFAIDAVGIG